MFKNVSIGLIHILSRPRECFCFKSFELQQSCSRFILWSQWRRHQSQPCNFIINPFLVLFFSLQVTWVRHTFPIPQLYALNNLTHIPDPRVTAFHDPGTEEFALRIRHSRLADSGYYECQVAGPTGERPALVRLIYLDVVREYTNRAYLNQFSFCRFEFSSEIQRLTSFSWNRWIAWRMNEWMNGWMDGAPWRKEKAKSVRPTDVEWSFSTFLLSLSFVSALGRKGAEFFFQNRRRIRIRTIDTTL